MEPTKNKANEQTKLTRRYRDQISGCQRERVLEVREIDEGDQLCGDRHVTGHVMVIILYLYRCGIIMWNKNNNFRNNIT